MTDVLVPSNLSPVKSHLSQLIQAVRPGRNQTDEGLRVTSFGHKYGHDHYMFLLSTGYKIRTVTVRFRVQVCGVSLQMMSVVSGE